MFHLSDFDTIQLTRPVLVRKKAHAKCFHFKATFMDQVSSKAMTQNKYERPLAVGQESSPF